MNCMWRVRAKLTDPSTSQRVLAMNEKKHVTWYATLDGALGKHKQLSRTEAYREGAMGGSAIAFPPPGQIHVYLSGLKNKCWT